MHSLEKPDADVFAKASAPESQFKSVVEYLDRADHRPGTAPPSRASRARLVSIVLSDRVEYDETGRVTMGPCFDRLQFRDFPSPPSDFWANICLTNVPPNVTEAKLTTYFVDSTSTDIIGEASGPIKFSSERPRALHTTFALAIPVKNLRFPRPGLYMIAVHINDEEIATRPLEVDPM